jgi:uncharacterized SAM-binding protein YcdF (DUF218 family)
MLMGSKAQNRLGTIRILTLLSFLIMAVLGMPVVARMLIAPIESEYRPFHPSIGSRFDAIVVLGGGTAPKGTLRPDDALLEDSRTRTICGSEWYAKGLSSRLVLSGGEGAIFGSGPKDALEMKRLALQLGVPEDAILAEARSRTTYENAVEVRRELGNASILLVTSAYHMPRAMSLFRKQGFAITPAPCEYRAKDHPPDWSTVTVFDFIPAVNSFELSTMAINEVIGTWLYRMAGKI